MKQKKINPLVLVLAAIGGYLVGTQIYKKRIEAAQSNIEAAQQTLEALKQSNK